jgi:hypothetical protein
MVGAEVTSRSTGCVVIVAALTTARSTWTVPTKEAKITLDGRLHVITPAEYVPVVSVLCPELDVNVHRYPLRLAGLRAATLLTANCNLAAEPTKVLEGEIEVITTVSRQSRPLNPVRH